MKPNYCLPIITARKDEVLEAVRAEMDDYRYLEVWLDYVQDADPTFAGQLVELLGDKLIAVFRRQNLESPAMDQAGRLQLLDAFGGTPVLIDLDVATQQPELEHIEKSGSAVNLLASYHNYQETPDTLQLRKIIDTMDAYRPAVYKLSTLCQSEGDAVRLLELLLELKGKGVRFVVSGMGGYGQVTRVFGTLWGNDMVFAPRTEEGRSAPGQLTRQELEAIFKELGK